MELSWAVIPTAGKGTRMYPATAVVPKALLPVGTRPMLQWAVQEAIAAGIRRLIIIRGPEQTLIPEFLEAATRAARAPQEDELARFGRLLAGTEVHWVIQPRPVGVGDAFARCRPLTGGDGFGVLLPDNWFCCEVPAIGQVADTFAATGSCTLGLTRVQAGEASLFGNVGGVTLEPLQAGGYRILALQDKKEGTFEIRQAGGILRGCARYALTPEFYDALAATGPPPSGEWDDVPAFQRLIAAGQLAGHEIEGRHYDVGLPAGYLAAAAYLAGEVGP